ncbi:hypothetical protein CH330_05330 [candidate division WOR-3 bacterium JGI_Cruoil_03_51_56]|uniref:Uncharacterized protein n=1 Tax=candidate division WOR-3 bacterium JGI_Cruoil_03_51_56 TaxID=1973747 RepID=A0A235BUZ1_UNCW3|nr:MAG: hypothetical protein CH330_05330 [candidate division WOR-3 bacterium JGI_Cruoil_03_51_56]
MLEQIVAVLFVVIVVAVLVVLVVLVRRMNVTVVKGKAKKGRKDFLLDEDIDELLISDVEPKEDNKDNKG